MIWSRSVLAGRPRGRLRLSHVAGTVGHRAVVLGTSIGEQVHTKKALSSRAQDLCPKVAGVND
jgi:hypothetical protein